MFPFSRRLPKMNITFHKTVLKPKKNKLQVVQTVVNASDPATDPSKIAKAREFLQARGINMVRGVYGAPV